jgi:hypothetical protein
MYIEPSSRMYASFVLENARYSFKKSAFGLRNSGWVFSKTISIVLAALTKEHLLSYVDDILLFTETLDQMFDILEMLLYTLQSANLRINPKKCEFFKDSIRFLGYIISRQGLSVDPKKLKR